jgi:hypothetical protein
MGVAKADQRQCAQFVPQGRLRRFRVAGHRAQPLRLQCLGGQVPVPARDQQPDDPKEQPGLGTPGVRYRRRCSFGHAQVPLGPVERPVSELIRRGQRREFGVGRENAGGNPASS